jgi:hypothetical protein
MQKFTVWQGQTSEIFFDSADTIRKLWLEAFHFSGPGGHNHVRTGFVAKFSPIRESFKPVAVVMADTLGEVFEIGNGMGDERQITYLTLGRMHSVSVGDFIQDSDGECHLVMPMGFLRLGRVTLEVPEVYYA